MYKTEYEIRFSRVMILGLFGKMKSSSGFIVGPRINPIMIPKARVVSNKPDKKLSLASVFK